MRTFSIPVVMLIIRFVLLYKEALLNINYLDSSLLSVVFFFVTGVRDVFPDDSPSGLPPFRGIKHQIDFNLGATYNYEVTSYQTNPKETKKLQCQVEELIAKGYVRESLSPCVVPVLLIPKKDGSWRMCIDCRVINNITIKYRHPIPKLNDLLDELLESCLFSELI